AGVLERKTSGRTAGKGEKVYRCARQRERGIGAAVNDLEEIARPACLESEFAQPGGGERRLGRGLCHDRVAGGNRRAELVAQQVERIVEGRDRPYDADRLVGDRGEAVRSALDDAAMECFAVEEGR